MLGIRSRRNSVPQLRPQPHQPLTSSKPPRKSTRRVTQFTVACQTEELDHDGAFTRTRDLSLLADSNNSDEPTNTAQHHDNCKQLLPASEVQLEKRIQRPSAVECLFRFSNNIASCDYLKDNTERQIDRLRSVRPTSQREDSLAFSEDQSEPLGSGNSPINEQACYNKLIKRYSFTKLPYELYLPLLTLEEFLQIREAWGVPEYRGEELAVYHPAMQERLTYRSLRTLMPPNWLNDEVVNAYIRMLNNHLEKTPVRIVNSFYVSQICQKKDGNGVQRIYSKNNFTAETKLIVPINRGNMHWCFLKVESGTVLVFDSMQSAVSPVPEAFRQYLRQYHNVREPFKNATDFPQQANQCDCGVFMLLGMKSQALGYPTWDFNQRDMQYFRTMIAAELMRNSITRREVLELRLE